MKDIKKYLIGRLIKIEDGYVDHEDDRGGETRFGITIETARSHGYMGSMRDLPLDVAYQIYATSYWNANDLDKMLLLSQPITEEVFDTGVNMGVETAGEFLQESLNAINNDQNIFDDLLVDGIVGSKTLSALREYLRVRQKEGESVMMRMLNGLQTTRYIDIAKNDKSQRAFVYGQIRLRVK